MKNSYLHRSMKNNRPATVWFYIVLSFTLLLSTNSYAGKRDKKDRTPEPVPEKLYSGMHYRLIGPFRGGRSVAVAGNAQQPHTFYFGAAGGGVWKTVNGGITWYNISDKYFKTAAVGALEVAPSDPNIIYTGMGESYIRGNMATGDGVYKSEDGGKTWQNIGLKQTHVISKIAVDPVNPKIVFVAALGHVFGNNPERGIYRSTDGGKTWQKVLYVDDKTGASDVAIDPANPRVIYAGMWQAYRKPWIMSSGGPGSGLYRSTDGGTTWKDISHSVGLPRGIWGKVSVAVAPSDPSRVYAFIEAKNGGVFRSDDGGVTWSRRNHDSDLTQRAWYFGRIFVDPKNKDRIYMPQVDGLFRSDDGGDHFTVLRTPHADNHVLWINPMNPKIMIGGNDGGASVSFDGGKSWSSQNNQPTAQFYHVSVDHQFPYHIFGAQQDNSTVEILSRSSGSAITERDWWPSAGGESGFVIPDLLNPNVSYGGSYDGVLIRYNRQTGQRQFIDVWPDLAMGHGAADLRDRFQWTFPIYQSKHNLHQLYTASQYVYRSTNQGMSWERISPDLTRDELDKQQPSGGPITKDNSAVEYYNTVFAFAESPVKAGVFWAGSDDGLVHLSIDNGKTWQNVTPKELTQECTISTIEPSHFAEGTAYVVARRYRQDDFNPYIYKTTDFGKHWTKITAGLPEDESSFVVREDPYDANLLFAGTLSGVYVSFNAGKLWQPLRLNLPHVAVRDLAIQKQADEMVLATHGRAFWILDHLGVLRQLTASSDTTNTRLYEPDTTYLTSGYGYYRPNMEVGENPANGLVVYYYLPENVKGKPVELTFSDQSGNTISSYFSNKTTKGKTIHHDSRFYSDSNKVIRGTLPTKAGVNRFVWNLRYPSATRVPGAVLWGGGLAGPRIVPGTYQMELKVGNQSMTMPFVVEKDPRYKASQEDIEAQFQLQLKVYKKLDEVGKAILKIRSAKSALQQVLVKVKDFPKGDTLTNEAHVLIKEMNQIEQALLQTKSHASEDPLNYPVRLSSKLASLSGIIGAAYDRPTQQEYEVFDELSKQTDAQLRKLKPVLDEKIPAFNKLAASVQLPAVLIQDKK
ncbi:MAG: exo-alpha-sialidase [Bacteroidales bacterium]|nr:exo-alpha-sialidase [Bacteroidales bacterium]